MRSNALPDRHARWTAEGEAFSVAVHPHREGAGRAEEELLAAGLHLPLYQREAWSGLDDARGRWLVVAYNDEGAPAGGFGVQVHGSRALPGHFMLLVERLGSACATAPLLAGLLALQDLTRRNPRCLRLSVELLMADPAARRRLNSDLLDAGFLSQPLRLYADTVAVDLRRPEEEIFASLHGTARRHIRAADKKPVRVVNLVDESFAERMNAMLEATMARTAGEFVPVHWERLLRLCANRPQLARAVGLIRTDRAGPDALVAYAVGLHHGDHVEYATAASVRDDSLRMPLAYSLAWELIRWGRSTGASWFDFGGVTAGGHDTETDPTGGISDFKRYFSRNVIRVGERLSFEPHPLRSTLARRVSSVAEWARKLVSG